MQRITKHGVLRKFQLKNTNKKILS